jgi:hypothetical protein
MGQVKSEIRDGMRIDWDAPIKMDDGLVLRADVFRPVEEGKCPVILSYGPYAKGLAFQDGYAFAWKRLVAEHPDVALGSTNKYQNWEVVDPEKWVPDGYVCVRVDSRGCGSSPGYVDRFSPRETRDLYLCVEWAGVQPWSNGKVGLNGISYYAINQWHVASLQPPHLAAMCVWEGAADWYRDMNYHGGILCTFWSNWQEMQSRPGPLGTICRSVQYGVGARGPRSRVTGEFICGSETLPERELYKNRSELDEDVLAHPLDDKYHKDRSPVWDKVTVPFLSAANWGGQGLHSRGNFEGFVRAASKEKWLEAHGLQHWTHFYTDYGVKLQKRFFDHFLKGIDNGWEKQPRVQLQVRRINQFVERMEDEWPIARTQWTKFYLNPTDVSLNLSRVTTQGSLEFEALGYGLTFLSLPLQKETEITGPSAVKLFASSSTTDADLFVVLRVFSPEMKEIVFEGAQDPHTPIGQGWLRASHHKLDHRLSTEYRPYHTHDELQPLTPGQIVELDIEIWPTSIIIPVRYRIALSVRGKDYEYPGGSGGRAPNHKNELKGCGPFLHDDPRDRPATTFSGTTKLHFGPHHAAYLLIPIIPEKY